MACSNFFLNVLLFMNLFVHVPTKVVEKSVSRTGCLFCGKNGHTIKNILIFFTGSHCLLRENLSFSKYLDYFERHRSVGIFYIFFIFF
jgi:hypothetical protein